MAMTKAEIEAATRKIVERDWWRCIIDAWIARNAFLQAIGAKNPFRAEPTKE